MSKLYRKDRKTHLRLLFFLIAITVIPTIVLSTLSYRVSIDNAQRQANTYSTKLLNQIRQSNDVAYDQMMTFVYDLTFIYPTVNEVLNTNPVDPKVLSLYDSMEKKRLVNEHIQNFYIVNYRSNKVFTSENSISIYDMDDFDDQNLLAIVKDPKKVAALRNELFLRKQSNGQNVLSYMVPYPNSDKPSGVITVDINADDVTHVNDLGNHKDGYLFITNKQNELLNSNDRDLYADITSGGEAGKYLLIRQNSAETGMHYIYAIQKTSITQSNMLVFWGILLLCLAFIVIGIGSAWFGTRNIYNPLQNLLVYLRQLAGDSVPLKSDVYRYLHDAVDWLNTEKTEYKEAVSSNRGMFKKKQIEELLSGQENGLGAVPDELRLKFPHAGYTAIVLEIDDLETFKETNTRLDQELLLYSIENIAEEVLASFGTAAACQLDSFRVLAFVNHDGWKDEKSEEACRKVQMGIAQYLKLSVSIGVGESAAGRGALKRAYEQAVQAVSSKVYFGKSSITHYDTVAGFDQAVGLGAKALPWNEAKEQFKAAMQTNELDKVASFIQDLGTQPSFVGIRQSELRLMFMQFISVLFDLCGEFSLPPADIFGPQFQLDQAVARIVNWEDMKRTTTALAEELIKRLDEKKNHVHHELIEKILVFIKENIDKDITLETIAEKVYMHPTYLSRICKTITGIGLGEQIVTTRIERAKELLVQTNDNINDISVKVGYTHPRAFYRIFNDYTGFTPGDYRKYMRLKSVVKA